MTKMICIVSAEPCIVADYWSLKEDLQYAQIYADHIVPHIITMILGYLFDNLLLFEL